MLNRVVHLAELPRKFAFVPPVRSIGYFEKLDIPHEQRVDGMQFCYRFHADSNWIRFDQGGHRRTEGFPQFLLKRPGETITTETRVKLDVFWISFDKATEGYFRERGLPDALSVGGLELSGRLTASIRDILSLCGRAAEAGTVDRVDVLSLALIAETLLTLDAARAPESAEERQLAKIASWLQLHFAEDIDFDRLARRHGFSRRSFFRYWNRHYPVTPARFVTRLRMEEARRLLSATSWSVGEIAYALGYASEAYFSGVFRKFEGIPPSGYRLRRLS